MSKLARLRWGSKPHRNAVSQITIEGGRKARSRPIRSIFNIVQGLDALGRLYSDGNAVLKVHSVQRPGLQFLIGLIPLVLLSLATKAGLTVWIGLPLAVLLAIVLTHRAVALLEAAGFDQSLRWYIGDLVRYQQAAKGAGVQFAAQILRKPPVSSPIGGRADTGQLLEYYLKHLPIQLDGAEATRRFVYIP